MTRSLFDGITAADVPDGWGVAGYIDGNWPDFKALALRWPGAVHISIAASAADDAKALDVEARDATPAQAPGWVTRQRAKGDPYPWVYMNASTWPEVVFEFASQKVAVPLWWVAKYDGIAVLPPGAIAKQHTNTAGYDQSVVADYVPGIDPAPKPTPTSAPQLEEDIDMLIIDAPRTAAADSPRDMWLLGNGRYRHIINPKSYQGYVNAGLKVAVIEYEDHADYLAQYGVAGVAA